MTEDVRRHAKGQDSGPPDPVTGSGFTNLDLPVSNTKICRSLEAAVIFLTHSLVLYSVNTNRLATRGRAIGVSPLFPIHWQLRNHCLFKAADVLTDTCICESPTLSRRALDPPGPGQALCTPLLQP